MRRLVALLALVAAPAALAAGPTPGTVQGGEGLSLGSARYTAVKHGARTDLVLWRGGEVARTVSVAGNWGIPLVSYGGEVGGGSHDGGPLVLAQADFPRTTLRKVSRFLVFDTRRLGAAPTQVRLRGDFAFDALAPHGRMLYLIQHVSSTDVTHYRVRGYDLRTGTLLKRVIADKRQASWVMKGMPMRRATSADGRWEYTLYSQPDNYPFVHALDTIAGTAVCIGIPWDWTKDLGPVSMVLRNGKLVVHVGAAQKRYAIDTRTLRLG